MIKIALIGSHGVGKTTTIEFVLKHRPTWNILKESTRHIVPLLGYENPYQYINDFGIAYYENMIISQWCVLDPSYNTLMKDSSLPLLIDRCPLDNLSYYYLHRTQEEHKFERLLTKLATYYLQFIDAFIYFPIGVFELQPDSMQMKETQNAFDFILRRMLKEHHVKCYCIKSSTVADRSAEIIDYIENIQNHMTRDDVDQLW